MYNSMRVNILLSAVLYKRGHEIRCCHHTGSSAGLDKIRENNPNV